MKGSDGRKTRLVYVANARIPTERAHGVQIVQMCDAFARAGREVTLVVPDRKNPITATSWEYYGLEPRFTIVRVPIFDFIPYDRRLGNVALWLTTLWFVLKARGVVRRLKPDVVYSRDAAFAPFTPGGVPFIFEAHDFPTRPRWYRGLWSRCARIVAVTEGLKKAFVEAGVPSERLLTSHDGVDLDAFRVAATKAEARRELGLPADGFTAVYAGHLYPYKGTDDLLDACARLKPGSRVVFVGGRADALSLIKERAAKLGVANAVFAGNVPHARVPLYLRAADAAVLPTRAADRHASEFLSPLKLFEYLAAGKAIVATDLPSAREVLGEGEAIFAKPGDPASLASAIERLAADPALAAALESASLRKASEHTWAKRAVRVLEDLPSVPARFGLADLKWPLLAALVLRLGYVLIFGMRLHGGDGALYLQYADLFRGIPAWSTPMEPFFQTGYPLFLAAIRSVFGERLVVIGIAQALISTATVALAALAAREFGDRRMGAWVAWIGALYAPAIIECASVYTETLYAFLLTAAVLAAVRAAVDPDGRASLFAGVLFALAGFVRELAFYNAVALAAVLGLWKRLWKTAAGLLIPALIVVAVFMAYNRGVVRDEALQQAAPIVAKGYELTLQDPNSRKLLQRWRMYPEGVWRFFRSPHRLAEISGSASTKEVLLSGDAAAITKEAPLIVAKGSLTLLQWLLTALAVLGLWKGKLRREAKVVFFLSIAFAAGTIILSGAAREQGFTYLEPLARYRFPVEPLLLILAVSGADALKRKKI